MNENESLSVENAGRLFLHKEERQPKLSGCLSGERRNL
jgi:hypothetical protein